MSWRPPPARLLLLLALLALGGGGPLPLAAQAGMEEVVGLRFQGNRRFSDAALASAILTRETECRSPILFPFCWAGAEFSLVPSFLNSRELTRDQARVRLFYYQRGYREAVVDTLLVRPAPGRVEVVFRIQENDPVLVRKVEFLGVEELPDSSILVGLPLRVGGPLSGITLEASRDTLTARLRNQGFAHAEVLLSHFIPRDSPYAAEVTFDLYPGPRARFGPLTVTGTRTVSEAVVRRMLPFREGDLFQEELRFVGLRNLYNLDIFRFVDIVPDLAHRPDSVVPHLVRVDEGDMHRVRTGAGLSTADCVNAEARWASRNFFGGARRLQITGRVSNALAPALESSVCPDAGTGDFGRLNWLLSAEFTQPWLFSPRTSLSAGLFGERQALPDIFVREALGVSLGLTRSLAPSTPLTLSYLPRISRLTAAEIFFCSTYLVCTPEDVGVLQKANWLSPVGLRLFQDRRNQALSPTRGYSALLDLEWAAEGTGSDFRYGRLMGEGTWYTQGRSGWVAATRLRGGWVRAGGFRELRGEGKGIQEEIVHPDKRLYAGGSNSVRGYAQNRLGPKVLHLPDVQRLLAPAGEGQAPCAPEELLALSCDAGALGADVFVPRPTGGTSLLEGSAEFRFPLGGPRWEGATFLDFGQVWGEGDPVRLGTVELTPGLGVRFFSPIGPIRVDLAYRLATGEDLQVVTSQIRPFDPARDEPRDRLVGPDGTPLDFVRSQELALLSPQVRWGESDPWSLRRFQIHLSIGQAF